MDRVLLAAAVTPRPAPGSADATVRLRLAAAIEADGEGLKVSTHGRSRRLRDASGRLEPALRALAERGAEAAAWVDEHAASDDPRELATLWLILEQLDAAGLLAWELHVAGALVAQLAPMSAPGGVLAEPDADVGADWRLSRFAYLRQEGDQLVCESALGNMRLRLAPAMARALLDPGAGAADRSAREVRALLAPRLAAARLIAPAAGEEHSTGLWEFHDALFHQRSRIGMHDAGYGGTMPFRGVLPQPGAVRAPHAGPRIALPRRAPADHRADPPLDVALERRRSVRHGGGRALSVAQLAEFLGRCQANRDSPHPGYVRRPYPSGGALYELELYPLVVGVEGLAPDLYHYDPSTHALHALGIGARARDNLLAVAQLMTQQARPPDVVLTITARHDRVAWKYRSMAYALILKHVGVLLQTMYLTADALDLGGCALGGGDSALFARHARIDSWREPAVGEFALSLPDGR